MDALDRVTHLTDALNGLTGFRYDANGNLLTVTDAKSQQTVYTYSTVDRVATRKDPLLNTETYGYDHNGNLTSVTDRKSQVTGFTYDALNRRTKTTYHDNTSTNYTYDAGNRLTQIQEKDSGGTVTATITRTYDGLDRLRAGGSGGQQLSCVLKVRRLSDHYAPRGAALHHHMENREELAYAGRQGQLLRL